MEEVKNVVANENFDWNAFENDLGVYDQDKAQITEAYDKTLSNVNVGEVVEGTVTGVNKREVIVNVGYKSEGIIPVSEFRYNPDLKVDKRIKWMAWWDIDETTAAAEMFKSVYGVPAAGDDPSREGRIFEYINVAYGERYDKLATAIQSGDSPDLFPFEIRDFPYGVIKGRYQPVDTILNLEGSKWDGARDVLNQFRLNGRYYCAIYEISFDSLLYYRKSVVEGAGLQDPRTLFENDEWTWDTFLDMARQFQQSGDG